MSLNNKEIQLEDVIQIIKEKLNSGGTVTFTPHGTSMYPMLRNGDGAVLQTDGVKPGAVGSGSCSGKRMGKASVSGKKRSTSHGKSVGSDLLRSKDSGWR